jgi:hypothetical protein
MMKIGDLLALVPGIYGFLAIAISTVAAEMRGMLA